MKVYPWKRAENQGDRKMIMRIMTSTAVVFRIVGGLLSLGVASLVGLLVVRRFAQRNDSWVKRGALMTVIGLLIFIILGGPAAWAGALNDALLSFGNKAETSPASGLFGFLIRSIAFGFFFQGFAVMMASYVYEVTGSRYLDRVTPTRTMKRRFKKNEEALVENDKPEAESLSFGLIVDDPIPWRTARYGMICARPVENMGHGVIVGSTGTGKTVTALSIAYQSAVLDSAVLYIDFKASLRTLNALKQAAAKAGKPFYSFDLGTGSTENSWFDPLDWEGTSSEKASMIVNSLQFPEDGSAVYYRGVATEWLIFQFDVLNEVGLYAGESSFDFLYETTNPAKIRDRIAPLRNGDERQRNLYTAFSERADAGSMKDLTGLRQNLAIVVNAGGDRLRPQSGAPAILMSRAVEEGAIVYFGLSPSTDLVALKTIGSLILRNLGVLSGSRMREADLGKLRPVITLVDEASRLQDRAIVLDNVLATAREAEIFLWMITQSFSTWPKSTIVEMTTNVWTYIVFRIQDTETAETLVSTLEDVPILDEMQEDRVKHKAFQGDVRERSGDGRTTLTQGPFLSDAPMGITSMEPLHAYIWFTGSWTRATVEEWSPKRLKKPDTIRNDAPLVRIVFMNYETEEEPIQGTTFSELVTSPDQITYNMQNTTLKRTRKETLTDDDYSNIHLPGSTGSGVQWSNDAPDSFGGYGPDQGTNAGQNNQPMSDPAAPMWGEADSPRWDDAPAPAQSEPMGEVVWGTECDMDEDDAPPTSHFYKPKPSASAPSTESSVPAPQQATPQADNPSFAAPAPQDDDEFASDGPAPAEDDDNGLVWDSAPAPQTTPAEPAPRMDPEPDRGFASDEPQWAKDSPEDSPAVTSEAMTQSQNGLPAERAEVTEEKGDSVETTEYTGTSSPGTDPAPSEETASPADIAPKEPRKQAPKARQGPGRKTTKAPGAGTPAPKPTPAKKNTTASAPADAAENAEVEQETSGEGVGDKKPQGKGPSKPKPKSRAKKNASDDWL